MRARTFACLLGALASYGCGDNEPAMTRGEAVELFIASACTWVTECDLTPDAYYSFDDCALTIREGLCGDVGCDRPYREVPRLDACLAAHTVESWPCARYPSMPDECRGIFARR